MVRRIESEIGPVDVLVNNAGITRDAMFRKMMASDWNAVIDVNLNSVFNVTHQVLNGMAERGWGRIINISSVNGVKGQFGQANYSAAKAGDIGFTRALAQEGARAGITVNAICPGYIDTEMNHAHWQTEQGQKLIGMLPRKRVGTPADLDALLVMLCSAQSDFINGAIISADDGMAAS